MLSLSFIDISQDSPKRSPLFIAGYAKGWSDAAHAFRSKSLSSSNNPKFKAFSEGYKKAQDDWHKANDDK